MCSTCCCCLVTCQETREIEVRSGRDWHPLRGFQPPESSMLNLLWGEKTLPKIVPFEGTGRAETPWWEEGGRAEAKSRLGTAAGSRLGTASSELRPQTSDVGERMHRPTTAGSEHTNYSL